MAGKRRRFSTILETIENRQLQWKTNRKSHMGFPSLPISITLNDFEQPQHTTLRYLAFSGARSVEANEDRVIDP